MAIQPLFTGQSSQPQQRVSTGEIRVDSRKASRSGAHTAEIGREDRAQFSAEAVELADTALTGARKAEILERIRSGFYNRSDVLDRVAVGVLRDL